jgi:uncharacterized iron-regulated protein
MRFLFCLLMATTISLQAQDGKVGYQFFKSDATDSNYEQLLSACIAADMVFFGELHDDSICHSLELQLLKDLHNAKKQQLVIGAEMLEADQQVVLNEYLSGLITEKNFKEALQLWKNYGTDYAPLVNYAKAQNLAFIATNIPRRYAAMVFRGGFEALNPLSKTAKKHIAPLPIAYDANLSGYKAMLEMGGMGHDTNLNFPRAQAIKDATMAHFISKNWKKGNSFLHFNGAYHSNKREGIIWYLLQKKPNLKIVSINTAYQAQSNRLEEEYKNTADFILVVQKTDEEE